jgi:hypothetical protein
MVIPDSLSLFTPEARLLWVAEAFDEQGLLTATHVVGARRISHGVRADEAQKTPLTGSGVSD